MLYQFTKLHPMSKMSDSGLEEQRRQMMANYRIKMSKMEDSGLEEQQRQMMANYRLIPDVDPIGTKHTLATDIQGLPRKANYKVRYITGGNNNTPNQDPPIVWLRVTGRHGFPVTPYISVPLPVLIEDFVPFSGNDVFWFDSSIKKA